MTVALNWRQFQGDAECAYLGEVQIGMIGRLSADPSTWWYKVDGIDVKWMAKGFGHVKGKASARRGIERAFAVWSERAGLL